MFFLHCCPMTVKFKSLNLITHYVKEVVLLFPYLFFLFLFFFPFNNIWFKFKLGYGISAQGV